MSNSISLPQNSIVTLNATAYAWDSLELTDGCILNMSPQINEVKVTVGTLILTGQSTIDLTAQEAVPLKPLSQLPKIQTDQNRPNRDGDRGDNGIVGANGATGVGLTLLVNNLEINGTGSFWVRTDGGRGGEGGNGQEGGKGASGPQNALHNPDGGRGGDGGTGGTGGSGGNTSRVVLKVGDNVIAPSQSGGVSPSSRPSEASIFGGIIVYGEPGAGGTGGLGGNGGSGGEGHQAHWPSSDSRTGANGNPEAQGNQGATGTFTN